MSGFDPAPSEDALAEERERWTADRDTSERVRDVVLGLRDPRSAGEIADRARCSANAARKHLENLADLGVARTVDDGGTTRYARNDEYVRWREANELATEHGVETLLDRIADLEARDDAFRERFGVDGPDAVAFPDDADHETLEERWTATGEWATVRRRMGIYRDAVRMARRRRDGLPA